VGGLQGNQDVWPQGKQFVIVVERGIVEELQGNRDVEGPLDTAVWFKDWLLCIGPDTVTG
jgi:hypothetical protein